MPPKPKFTREEIVAAALELVSEKGMSALTSRDLGTYTTVYKIVSQHMPTI